jgi:hypothetical protein
MYNTTITLSMPVEVANTRCDSWSGPPVNHPISIDIISHTLVPIRFSILERKKAEHLIA